MKKYLILSIFVSFIACKPPEPQPPQAPVLDASMERATWKVFGKFATWGALIGRDYKGNILLATPDGVWERQAMQSHWSVISFDTITRLNPQTGEVTNISIKHPFKRAIMGPEGRYVIGFPASGMAGPGEEISKGEYMILNLETEMETSFTASFKGTGNINSHILGGLCSKNKTLHACLYHLPDGKEIGSFPLVENGHYWVCTKEAVYMAENASGDQPKKWSSTNKQLSPFPTNPSPNSSPSIDRCVGSKYILTDATPPNLDQLFDHTGQVISSLPKDVNNIVNVSASGDLFLGQSISNKQTLLLVETMSGKILGEQSISALGDHISILGNKFGEKNTMILDKNEVFFSHKNRPEIYRWSVSQKQLTPLRHIDSSMLIKGLKSKDWRVVRHSARMLGFDPKLANQELIQLLGRWTLTKKTEVQVAVIWALGRIGSSAGQESFDVLKIALRQHSDDFLRRANRANILLSMAQIDHVRAEKFFNEELNSDQDDSLKRSAEKVLKFVKNKTNQK